MNDQDRLYYPSVGTSQLRPGKYFISHSYQDKDLLPPLIASLPQGVSEVIFGRIDSRPSQMVSGEVLPVLLSCDGLIYIDGGHSSHSQWVVFETDFALRSGLNVFAYTAGSRRNKGVLAPSQRPLLDLPTWLIPVPTDTVADAQMITVLYAQIRYLMHLRKIELWNPIFTVETADHFITRGGCVILLWFGGTERPLPDVNGRALFSARATGQLVIASLDGTYPLWSTSPGWPYIPGVTLKIGDDIALSRVDDLIVMIYRKMFVDQRH